MAPSAPSLLQGSSLRWLVAVYGRHGTDSRLGFFVFLADPFSFVVSGKLFAFAGGCKHHSGSSHANPCNPVICPAIVKVIELWSLLIRQYPSWLRQCPSEHDTSTAGQHVLAAIEFV